MYRSESRLSDSLRKNKKYQDIKWHRRVRIESNTIPIIVIATMAFSLIFSLSVIFTDGISWNNKYAYAQAPRQKDNLSSENKVTIHLNSVEFTPLTYSGNNQLKV
jgi:hypothetical protein